MRPVRLLNREVSSLRGTTSSTCKQEVRQLNIQQRRYRHDRGRPADTGENNLPLYEKFRRKIWGTDNPPGLSDPYGGEGRIEQAIRQRRREREEKNSTAAINTEEEDEKRLEQEKQEELEELNSGGEPLTSWDGLDKIGHLGRWSDYPPTDADEVVP